MVTLKIQSASPDTGRALLSLGSSLSIDVGANNPSIKIDQAQFIKGTLNF
jgi:hypothetical protein